MGIQHKAGLFPIFGFIIPYYLFQVMFYYSFVKRLYPTHRCVVFVG